MSSWKKRAWKTHRIGRRSTGHHNLDLIIGQGIMRFVRRLFMFPVQLNPKQHNPIVIGGLPRTGTTFLQRFLHEQKIGKGQTLFAQLFPSPMLQKVLRPLVPVLERISPTRHHDPKIHKTGFMQVETDEAGLFFQQLDGFFLYAFFWALDDEEQLPYFDIRNRNETRRDFAWLSRCWSLNTNNEVIRPLAKLFGIGAAIPEFLEYFPQGKIIYTARDPREVIPSTLSLLRTVLQERYDWNEISHDKQMRYYSRICDALIELMRRFHQAWEAEKIDRSRCLILPYELLKSDFDGVMNRICSFVGHDLSPSSLQAIHDISMKQKTRQSLHKYRLDDFGLDESGLIEKTSFFHPYWQPEMWEQQ